MKKTFNLVLLFVCFITLSSFEEQKPFDGKPTFVFQSSCDASQNLDETCRSFIGRCRKGGINSEFPGQFYDVKIREVKNGTSADHKKAWKLLNDNRFKK